MMGDSRFSEGLRFPRQRNGEHCPGKSFVLMTAMTGKVTQVGGV